MEKSCEIQEQVILFHGKKLYVPFLAALAAAISDDVDGAFVIEAKASNWAVV